MSRPDAAVAALQEEYAPITEAEARLVLKREERSGRPVDELVAEVKAERVGPAAEWETTSPTDDDPDLDVEPSVTELGYPGDVLSEEDLAAAKAADLVAYLEEHPDEVDRVEAAELARNGDPRSTVLAAIDAVRAGSIEPVEPVEPVEPDEAEGVEL